MAAKLPVFRKKFPLLVTGGLLALPLLPAPVGAAEQFACQAAASGGWACAPTSSNASLPARPQKKQDVAAAPAKAGSSSAETVTTIATGESLRGGQSPADFSRLDWVPRSQLSPEQLAEVGPYCSGGYVEPKRPGMNDDTPMSQAPMFVSAKASRYAEQEQVATLAGDVVLRQANIQAEADEANLYQAENRGELKGDVRLRSNGMLVVGDQAEIQLDSGAAKIEDAEYVMHAAHARGSAKYVKRGEDAVIRLKDGTYTTCPPGSNAWQVKGNNIKLDPATGMGTATNATLRIKDIPVFYTPYIQFPIDDRRQSGFLAPTAGYSNSDGVTLMTPYYFNLAPNYDATLYPRLMSQRGLMMSGEGRYLTQSSEGKVSGSYLDDQDDENKGQPKYEKTRTLASWQHTQGLDERLLGQIDYTDISDPYYFQDLGTDLDVTSQTYVNQQGQLTWRGDSYTARFNAQSYELASVTDITPYDRLPQISLDGSLPFQPGGLNFTYGTEYVSFDRNLDEYVFNGIDSPDLALTGLNRATGERSHVQPGISLPLESSWGYLTPTVKYLYTNYSLDLDSQGQATLDPGQEYDDNQTRDLALYSLDSGLYFDRNTTLFGTGLRQTLEPRLYYLYVPYKDQNDLPVFDTSEPSFSYASLFRENRFVGKDRIGDSNQLSAGTSSRFIEDNGFERASVGVGQAFYFEDRQVQMPGIETQNASVSPTAFTGQYRFDRDWRLSSDYAYDGDRGETNSGNLMFHYQPEAQPNKVFNAGYRYRNDAIVFNQQTNQYQYGDEQYKIEQSDVSMIWPVVPQWSAIARWQFDYNRSRTLEAFGGFEYDSCCWKLRLVNRYWIEPDDFNLTNNEQGDHGVFLQIVLKGLGGVVGNQVDSFLDQGIQGYREREDQAL
ncbi:LPS-assembly protein LptD [Pseudomonas sp. N040]|uniref:LPS-assembly protein LptD n=1 Tax=Pseudomonas sp. N040 TaxID=2785325 RepID=UPI0018A31793|nr:LPS-assembly protein LptD [Pseudomonas sp. N040]MBF7728490.1 LPS-assembly protein LptD [Pseudomonas sp. N040]MBW7012130.1 LPS assembly protein LptD [Pseudomonas sp. N040]